MIDNISFMPQDPTELEKMSIVISKRLLSIVESSILRRFLASIF